MTGDQPLQFHLIEPDHQISDFVYCFSSFNNLSAIDEGIIIPNGKIDLILSLMENGDFQIVLLGLETQPKIAPGQTISKFFSISFQPLAVEYILKIPVAGILNKGELLSDDSGASVLMILKILKHFAVKPQTKLFPLFRKILIGVSRICFAIF